MFPCSLDAICMDFNEFTGFFINEHFFESVLVYYGQMLKSKSVRTNHRNKWYCLGHTASNQWMVAVRCFFRRSKKTSAAVRITPTQEAVMTVKDAK